MKVLGIGVDIIHNKRFKLLSKKKSLLREYMGKMKLNFLKILKIS